jgi:hypothetical protein
VQKRGNGQYGIEYGDEAFNFPEVKTIPNNVLISLRTAGFNMTLDQILEQSFEDIIETETTIPDVNKKVKSNLNKKLVDYINSLIPNYIKTNSDKVRIVSELASMFMLNQDFQTNEELLKNSQDVEKMIKAFTPQELKEEDKDTLDNMIANAIIEKLAKDGLSEKDIYDNFFGKNNADLKPTPTTQSSTSVNVIPLNESQRFTRESAEKDTEYMYLFTDNAGRTSGSGVIDPNSWYAKKYGTDKKYASKTQAVARGLNNVYPITTMVDDKRTQWTDTQFDAYKKIIDDEIETIKQASKKYKGIKFGAEMPFGKGAISNMKDSAPKIWNYLNTKLAEIGIDNTGDMPVSAQPTTTKSQINQNKPDGLPPIGRTPENCP